MQYDAINVLGTAMIQTPQLLWIVQTLKPAEKQSQVTLSNSIFSKIFGTKYTNKYRKNCLHEKSMFNAINFLPTAI